MTPAPQTKLKSRYWPVDTLRGVAIVLMVIYHFTWDMAYFGVYQGDMLSAPWRSFAHGIATLFIFVMGVSLTLSYHRTLTKTDQNNQFGKFLLRGAKIFGLGMVVTVATYFAIGRGFVVFGILHLIGLSIILAYPFLKSRRGSLAAGLLVVAAGVYIDGVLSQSPWLLWLGVKQYNRYMVDYYPVLPWFGVALLGIFAGHTLYPRGIAAFTPPDFSQSIPVRGLSFLGRRSLLIYLLHQPLLLAILFLLGIASL